MRLVPWLSLLYLVSFLDRYVLLGYNIIDPTLTANPFVSL